MAHKRGLFTRICNGVTAYRDYSRFINKNLTGCWYMLRDYKHLAEFPLPHHQQNRYKNVSYLSQKPRSYWTRLIFFTTAVFLIGGAILVNPVSNARQAGTIEYLVFYTSNNNTANKQTPLLWPPTETGNELKQLSAHLKWPNNQHHLKPEPDKCANPLTAAGENHLLYDDKKLALINNTNHKQNECENTITANLTAPAHKLDGTAIQGLKQVAKILGRKSAKTLSPTPISQRNLSQYSFAQGTIYSSLFVAGKKAGLTSNLILEMATIFAWDIDFALDLRKGDQFVVIYTKDKILAASFTNRGQKHVAIRYTDKQGKTDYYSPQGHSLRKAFLRTPVKFSRISSHFNLKRKHPILNRIRAHRGVDYAAPTGTPVRATANGKIIFRGVYGGYGKTIIIRHQRKYSTLYAHLSRYHKKIRSGRRIQQGEIIGYIGSTGLATGPHLHYELRINGRHRNPLTVKLPKAIGVNRRQLNAFRKKSRVVLEQLARLQGKHTAL